MDKINKNSDLFRSIPVHSQKLGVKWGFFRSIPVHSTAWHTLKSCVNRLFSGAYPFTFTGSSVTCVFRWIPVHYTYSAPPAEKSEYAVTARKPQNGLPVSKMAEMSEGEGYFAPRSVFRQRPQK